MRKLLTIDTGGIARAFDGNGVAFYAIIHRPAWIIHVYKETPDGLVLLERVPGLKHSCVSLTIQQSNLIVSCGARTIPNGPYEPSTHIIPNVATPPRTAFEYVVRQMLRPEALV